MRRKWTTLWQLSPPERRLLIQSLVLLPLTSVGLGLFGLRKCQSVLLALVPAHPAWVGPDASLFAGAASRMVRLAAVRGLSRPLCLPRSLVLWFLLRRRKIDARLRIGVRRQSERFDAHAWVEWSGFVVNDRRNVLTRYAAFDEFAPVQASPRSRWRLASRRAASHVAK